MQTDLAESHQILNTVIRAGRGIFSLSRAAPPQKKETCQMGGKECQPDMGERIWGSNLLER